MPDAKTDTLIPVIFQKVTPDSIVYSDTWRGYNARMYLILNIAE